MFPWLSQIANTHQRYKMKRLKFHYVPVAGTQTRGRVILAFTIDPTENAPVSMSQITQYPNYEANSVWSHITLTVDLSDRREELYTRSGFVPSTDIKTYDLGKLFIGISDTSDTNTIGQLFVEYEVELMTPKPTSCPSSVMEIAGFDQNNLFGTVDGTITTMNGSNILLEHDSVNNDFMHFKAPGVYYVLIRVVATTGVVTHDDTELDGHTTTLDTSVGGIHSFNVIVNSDSRVQIVGTGFNAETRLDVRVFMSTESVQLLTV
jgi:hypothetical protein